MMAEAEVNATDGAKKRAADLGLTDDLEKGLIEGSGEGGRIQAPDIDDYYQEQQEKKKERRAEEGSDDEDEDVPEEFDRVEGEKLSPLLVPHLTDKGLDILEAGNDDAEIQGAIDRERSKRDVPPGELDEDAIDLLKKFARIMRKPMSRSQVARRSQALLTRLGYDWRRDEG